MYEKKEILTKKEQLANIVYFIFRYTLYLCGFITLYTYNKDFTVVFAAIFALVSYSFYLSKQKIIYDYEYKITNLIGNIQKSNENKGENK